MSSHHPISSLPHDASTILTAPVPTSGPHLSPILSHRPRSLKTDVASTSQPQFAELLTPQKLRRRRRQSYQSIPASAPLEAGPSNQGFYTNDGDLFRGAGSDPTDHPTDNDDAITLSGTSVSCLSSSSTGGLEKGRRATMAVLERFGTVIGVRRGSSASGSTDVRSDGEKEKRSRRLSRTVSAETVTDHPKRLHLPRKREFVLLLPSGSGTPWDLSSSDDTRAQVLYPSDRVITTSSLPAVLDQIRNLRAASGMAPEVPRQPENRAGRPRPKMPRGSTSFVAPPIPVRPARSRLQTLREVPVRPKSVSDLMGLTKPYVGSTPNLNYMRSGELPQPSRVGTPTGKDEGNGKGKGKGCWWLDVSCPGWEDLRVVGELLSLHPLTLEDVLQQDPREKLDMFEKLGYYFVVVRALDEGYFKYTPGSAKSSASGLVGPVVPSPELKANASGKEHHRRGWGMGRGTGRNADKSLEKVEIVEDNPGKEGLEGVGVGAVNVYLVVFADGIISFHFEDISKHTKRVLDRIISLTEENHGSDWVAHGLLDSIVDAFFPLIRYVDTEVDEIDSLSIDPTTDPRRHTQSSPESPPVSTAVDPKEAVESSEKNVLDEKPIAPRFEPVRPPPSPKPSWRRWARAHLPAVPSGLIYIRLFFLPTSSAAKRKHEEQPKQIYDRSTMLKRITDTRRLVTGLSRLLGAKHQVIGRLRKRGAEIGEGVEAYIGDLEDHVLLLQTSLYHYEYILLNCQPAYLSHLSVSFSFARSGTDQAILALSTVTISVLAMQFVIGLLSMNVHGPRNGAPADAKHREANGSIAPFNYFAGACVFIFLVACGMLSIIRYWRWAARVKWAGKRGTQVPPVWAGYWGWE